MQSNKKKAPRVQWRMVALLAAVAAVLGIGGFFIVRGVTPSLDRPVKLSALATMQVVPFGNDVLFYDGMSLFCVTSNGSHKWSFLVGQNASFHASSKRVAAWSANQLYILDQNGQPTYNDRMPAQVQFARAGNRYVAAFVGERDKGSIYVLDNLGKSVDNIVVENQTPLDIGFFGDAPELIWVMNLDAGGTVPIVTMQTYEPSRMTIGSTSLGEQLVYKVLYNNGLLHVVDTRRIRTYNHKIIEDKNTPPVLIYGWYLQDVRQVGRDTIQLLVPNPQISGQLQATDLRLIINDNSRVLHLPAPCVGALLGKRGVYTFSGSTVYFCRYGENTFTEHELPVYVISVLGMTDNNRAIVASETGEVYLMPLPS